LFLFVVKTLLSKIFGIWQWFKKKSCSSHYFKQLSCCKFLKSPYEIVSNIEKEKRKNEVVLVLQ
jgi:hypothetical protein